MSASAAPERFLLQSPDATLQVAVQLDDQGRPLGEVFYQKPLLARLNFGLSFLGSPALQSDQRIIKVERRSRDTTYSIPVGKTSSARDHHHELIVSFEEANAPHRRWNLALRAFDDGIAFRYELSKQPGLEEFTLADEFTRFTVPGEPLAHALPLDHYTTPYEVYYKTQPLAAFQPDQLIGLPLLLERRINDSGKVWVALTEADLTDYAGMYLTRVADQEGTLAVRLSPLPRRHDGAKVVGHTPHCSPWRVLMIAQDPGRLIESDLVFHLNPPCAIADPSWIKPGKTTFPWWNGYVLKDVDFEPGLNTATHKHYIDFCAEQGIEYHSLDGTDTAWYGGPIIPNAPTDITTAVPEIDMEELLHYARAKGIRLRLWMHWRALQAQIDQALPLYEQWGIEGIMVDFMDRDDQEMVAFYHEVAEKAARHHLTVTWHGAYKPTGLERTWPNVLTYEAALNQEYNKWSPVGTPPEHNLNVAFVRMLAGPVDYHQGGMRNVLPRDYTPRNLAPTVQGTRGHQLALYIVYQNHLPMVADFPAAYRGQPGLEFLARIPCLWDETRVLHAEVGQCLVMARRRGTDWYLGGLSAAQPRVLNLPLDFLGPGDYQAELHLDHPIQGPTALAIRKQSITATNTLTVELAEGGGFAGRLIRGR